MQNINKIAVFEGLFNAFALCEFARLNTPLQWHHEQFEPRLQWQHATCREEWFKQRML